MSITLIPNVGRPNLMASPNTDPIYYTGIPNNPFLPASELAILYPPVEDENDKAAGQDSETPTEVASEQLEIGQLDPTMRGGCGSDVAAAHPTPPEYSDQLALAIYERDVTSQAILPEDLPSEAFEKKMLEVEAAAEHLAKEGRELWKIVAHNLNNELISKYRSGMFIWHRQQNLAKPGRGVFVAELKLFANEHGVSIATLYRRLKWYVSVREGLRDLLLVRLSQHAKDSWGGVFDHPDSVDAFDQFVGSEEADRSVEMLSALIAEAEAQLNAAKERTKDMSVFSKTIRLHSLGLKRFKAVDRAHKKLVSVLGPDEFSHQLAEYIVTQAAGYAETLTHAKRGKEGNRA